MKALYWWLPVITAATPPPEKDERLQFAVIKSRYKAHWREQACLVGQVRTAAYREVQTNLVAAMIKPLQADVFLYVSRRHEIAHPVCIWSMGLVRRLTRSLALAAA